MKFKLSIIIIKLFSKSHNSCNGYIIEINTLSIQFIHYVYINLFGIEISKNSRTDQFTRYTLQEMPPITN